MNGKVVLITGASSGIGAGTAVLFAGRGCRLSLTGRNAANLQETQKECVRVGAKADDILLITADLEKEEDIKRIIVSTIEKFQKLDVLVNNAGMAKAGFLESQSLADYDTIFKVNVRSVFYLTQLAVPYLILSKGNVVCVSSVASLRPVGGSEIVYSMSKAALDHFVRISALDLAPKQVRVNAVNPGYVPTNFEKNVGADRYDEEMLNKLQALGRGGTVEEIARAIAFLADDEQSAFITGVTLPVDGGFCLIGPMPTI